jgi:chaperonin cofactor prefoldin
MTLEQRIEKLEAEMRALRDDFSSLKKEVKGKEDSEYQINVVDDYMIKLVYTGIYSKIKENTNLEIGFPKNRRKLAQEISVGQKMFIYVTSPVKKIIGLMTVKNGMQESEDPHSRWPYNIKLEWEIGPKQGVSFSDIGLPIRPRVGDTLYSIDLDKAKEIINLLNQQDDLTDNNIDFLSKEYGE